MKGLLKKDLLLLKQQKKFILLIIIISLIVACSNSQSSFITSYLTFLGTGLILNSFSYDTYQNGLTYLLALPFSKKDYVKEKYIYALIITICSWLSGIIISLVFSQFRMDKELVLSHLMILMIAALYLSVIMPINIKYGREKGSTIIIIIVLLVSLAFFQFIDFKNLSMPLPPFMFGLLVAAIIFYLFSYHQSISILNHKEL